MLGEHRQVLADLLWMKAQKMINDLNGDGAQSDSDIDSQTDDSGVKKGQVEQEGSSKPEEKTKMSENSKSRTISEEDIEKLNRYFHDIRSLEDIQMRAKSILKNNCLLLDETKSFTKLNDLCEHIFMSVIFSYHPDQSKVHSGIHK